MHIQNVTYTVTQTWLVPAVKVGVPIMETGNPLSEQKTHLYALIVTQEQCLKTRQILLVKDEMMIEKFGDLFTTDAPAIGHGVNVHGKMGAGIAVQFRKRFPIMYYIYTELCADGTMVPGSVLTDPNGPPVVYNIASQDLPGAHARLEWLEEGLRTALSDAHSRGLDRVALPLIGCGIGGLDEADVVPLMQQVESEYPSVQIELWRYQG